MGDTVSVTIPALMKRFYLNRSADPTGTSGTGRVAEGCLFSDGAAVIHWCPASNAIRVASTGVYQSVADVLLVHGHAGATRVEWIDLGENKGGADDGESVPETDMLR